MIDMQVIKKNKVLYVDVDKTLIMWHGDETWHPHIAHINLLKQFKTQGHGIIVWSSGGWEWAQKAVELLGIQTLVDYIVNKPDWWCDDMDAEKILLSQNYIFLDDNTKIE